MWLCFLAILGYFVIRFSVLMAEKRFFFSIFAFYASARDNALAVL